MRTLQVLPNEPKRAIAPITHPSWRAAATTAQPRQPRRAASGESLAAFWALVDADD